MSRELLQQALGALGTSTWDHTRAVGKQELITALRAALAQPEPEPVAWCELTPNGSIIYFDGKPMIMVGPVGNECHTVPLFTSPPAAPIDGFGGNLDKAFEPAAPAVCCRNELLTALHTLASNYENALGMFGQDGEGRRKAEGDLAHAMKVAAKHNRNGPGCAAPAVPSPNKPTVQRLMDLARKFRSAPGDLYDDAYKELERACYEALSAAPAVPAVCDGGTCGLGGYCANCPRQAAAPAVPVSWDRLRVLMDGIPTREEFIGGQRQKYVAKEAVMSWLHEGQLRAKREAVQPAAPTVQVVLRQPNLFASAPAVREPKDTETSRLLANVADAARRLVEHADFQLGGILSADSKAKEIPSKAVSQVKARHLASLRDRVAELDAAHGIGGGGK